MSTSGLIIGIVLIAAAAVLAWAFVQKRRTRKLRRRFGTEYQQALREYGSRARAERALERRAERREKYRIRALTEQEQQRYSESWRNTQARFVDDPPAAIHEADDLVCNVMRDRGYPMSEFTHRAEDLSVDYPHVVRNYRSAHEIASMERQGQATTEDLRRAMVAYRALFDELLEAQPAAFSERRR